MLEEAMTALAAAGGTAVVQAAGTDAWQSFRQQVARLFARGDKHREHAELERLDQTAAVLETSEAGDTGQLRIRQEASWQTRFETLLEGLDQAGREQVAAELRDILERQAPASRTVSAGAGGIAAGGNVTIQADNGSIAGGVIHGGASIGTPTRPDPSQG